MDDEFNNFMQKVTEVESIVKGLCSRNKNEADKATMRADLYLTGDKKFDENELKVKSNRTVINKNALKDDNSLHGDAMNKNAFMTYVEKDAKKRAEDRRQRKEISDDFKKKGNAAFKAGNYEKALDCYSKAIQEIKDSWILYSNRAVTHLRLGLYKKALEDCRHILQLDEDNLKGWLMKARAHYHLQEKDEVDNCVKEAETRHPESKAHIQEYIKEWKESESESDS